MKEVDELVRDIKATGKYDVQTIGAHNKVIDSTGNLVYVFPKSPSDRRWRDNAIRGLVKEGVFEHDPKKTNGQPKRTKHHLADPEIQAKKVAAVKARNAHYAEITKGIRDRLGPLITKVGGWGMRQGQISASELGTTAMYWGQGRPDVFKTQGAAKSSAQSNMRQGGTCSEQACTFWDAFVSAWESADDPRLWYFDLVRESKGLEKTKVTIGGVEQVEPKPEKKPNLRRAGKVKKYMAEPAERHPLEPPPLTGQLALKAVYLMSVGRTDANEHEILDVGEQILALEAAVLQEEE